jgi:hypothetical protein
MLWRAGQRQRGGGLVGGVLVVTLGGFWLLQNFDRVSNRLFLPVVLIALGVGLVLRTMFYR